MPFFVHFAHFPRILLNFPGPYSASIRFSSSPSDTSRLRGTRTSKWKWLLITAYVYTSTPENAAAPRIIPSRIFFSVSSMRNRFPPILLTTW